MWTTSTTGTETERVRLDSAGVVKINPLTDPALPAGYNSTPGLLVQNEGASLNGLSLARASSADVYAEIISLWRSRGTFASKVAVANGDGLGQITVMGWSGANWLPAATIQTAATGTITTTAIPTTMYFNTMDSAGTLATRLSIGPDGATAITGALTATVPAGAANAITGQSTLSIVTGGQGQLVAYDDTTMAIDVGGTLAFRGKYTAGGATAGFGGFKMGKSNATDGNLDTHLSIFTRSNATAITERVRIGATGLVGIGAKADGTAVAQLDVLSTVATTAGLIVRNHASAAAGLVFLAAHNNAGSLVILGANNTGWVTDAISATAIGSYATKRIPVYNSSGTLQGYIPLYS
jgi:hypothetical protein